ncbi:MAG: GxxExxY protein [Caulobacteraceae bacterium]
MPIVYNGMKVDLGYRLDLLVADLVVVEVEESTSSAMFIAPSFSAI